ncbi:unnamed protein product [Boreogadus saida]
MIRSRTSPDQGVTSWASSSSPAGGPASWGPGTPRDLSLAHSSPSPIHRHAFSSGSSPSDPAQPSRDASEPERTPSDRAGTSQEDPGARRATRTTDPSCPTPRREHPGKEGAGGADTHLRGGAEGPPGASARRLRRDPGHGPSSGPTTAPPGPGGGAARGRLADPADTHPGSPLLGPGAPEENGNLGYREGQDHERVEASLNNNNHVWNTKSSEEKTADPLPPVGAHTMGRTQLFALYNHTGELENSSRFYSLRVPLCIQKEAGLTTEVDAHWLDHMTQHFTSGARLIDGFFHLADDNDSGISSVDSVFIFQSPAEESTATSYDAIVVEQWTVVDGVVVRTDYIPLLQSLAPYGWRLMCVLPTPVVRTNSDGSLSTKQILFLQRPTLQRKRKDFKMLNLRGRSKARKSYSSETPEKERGERLPRLRERGGRAAGQHQREEEEGGLMVEEEEREEERCQGAGTWGGEEALMREAELQTDSSPPPPSEGGSVSDGNQEEECAEVDWASTAKQEKSVRWTDVCQRADSGLEEEMKDRIKPQLSERALFSGVC